MKREEIEDREKTLMDEIVKRRKLGEFDQSTGAILMIAEITYEILRHLRERIPAGPVKKQKK